MADNAEKDTITSAEVEEKQVNEATQQLDGLKVDGITDAAATKDTGVQQAEEQDADEEQEEEDIPKDIMGEVCDELMKIPSVCPECRTASMVVLQQVRIPGFDRLLWCKEDCESCGFSKTEQANTKMLTFLGTRFELPLNSESNWQQRKVLKSATCKFSIPEIGLEDARTMGGAFLTLSELLDAVRAEMSRHPAFSDVGETEGFEKLIEFVQSLNDVINGELDATFIIEDEGGNCYVEPLGEEDPHLKSEHPFRLMCMPDDGSEPFPIM